MCLTHMELCLSLFNAYVYVWKSPHSNTFVTCAGDVRRPFVKGCAVDENVSAILSSMGNTARHLRVRRFHHNAYFLQVHIGFQFARIRCVVNAPSLNNPLRCVAVKPIGSIIFVWTTLRWTWLNRSTYRCLFIMFAYVCIQRETVHVQLARRATTAHRCWFASPGGKVNHCVCIAFHKSLMHCLF